jgi:hypothetical protein
MTFGAGCKQDDILEKEEGHHHEVADRMTKLENLNYDLVNENCELREHFLELKPHSMKYNLIKVWRKFSI